MKHLKACEWELETLAPIYQNISFNSNLMSDFGSKAAMKRIWYTLAPWLTWCLSPLCISSRLRCPAGSGSACLWSSALHRTPLSLLKQNKNISMLRHEMFECCKNTVYRTEMDSSPKNSILSLFTHPDVIYSCAFVYAMNVNCSSY